MGITDRFRSDSSSSSTIMNLVNFAIRILQAILAAAVIGIYASEYSKIDTTAYYTVRHLFYLAVAIGVLSLLTALAFAILPFILSYRIVCILSPWDWILFFIWTATFAEMKKNFPWGALATDVANQYKDQLPSFKKFQDAVWVDLTCMLLWLITAIMGVVMLFVGGRFSGRKTTASYV